MTFQQYSGDRYETDQQKTLTVTSLHVAAVCKISGMSA